MGYPCLAPVQSTWSGTLTVTSGAVSTVFTARRRESAASFWATVIAGCYAELGLSLRVSQVNDPTMRISGSAAFDLAVSGLGDRLDLNGSYTGASSYDTDGATMPGDAVIVDGLIVGAESLMAGRGVPTSDGSYGARGASASDPVALRVTTSAAGAWYFETLSGVYDIAHEGRVMGRVRIDEWQRTPIGKRRSDVVTLVAMAQAVAE